MENSCDETYMRWSKSWWSMDWYRSAMASLYKFQRLSWSERWLLVQALLLLPIIGLALQWLGFRRWQSVLAKLAPIDENPAGSQVETAVQQAYLTAKMVKAAACHSPYR